MLRNSLWRTQHQRSEVKTESKRKLKLKISNEISVWFCTRIIMLRTALRSKKNSPGGRHLRLVDIKAVATTIRRRQAWGTYWAHWPASSALCAWSSRSPTQIVTSHNSSRSSRPSRSPLRRHSDTFTGVVGLTFTGSSTTFTCTRLTDLSPRKQCYSEEHCIDIDAFSGKSTEGHLTFFGKGVGHTNMTWGLLTSWTRSRRRLGRALPQIWCVMRWVNQIHVKLEWHSVQRIPPPRPLIQQNYCYC